MLNRKENIENSILDAMLMLLFLFFMLSVSNHDSVANSIKTRHGISGENLVSQSNAIIKIEVSTITIQKDWASQIKYPKYIYPVYNIVSGNRNTESQISIQRDAVFKNRIISLFNMHYHLFFSKEDDIPLIS